jgi:predicted peroxiredoxin
LVLKNQAAAIEQPPANRRTAMPEPARKLVVVITHGADHELSSVAFTIINGGLTAGLNVSVFLTSAAVDLARKRAIDGTIVHPLEPLAALVNDFLARGGTLWACKPCVNARGYEQSDLIDGVEITGASKMHALINAGAATLSF